MSQDRSLKFAAVGAALVAGALYLSPPAPLLALMGGDSGDASSPVVDMPSPEAVVASGIVNPLSSMKPDDFAEIVTRPLFNPDRAAAVAQTEPPPDPNPPTEPPPDPQPDVTAADFDLLAIAGQDETRIALVRFKKTNQLFRVRKDQFVNDWKVADVGARDASLQNGDTTFTLHLFDGSHKVPPPPPVDGSEPQSPTLPDAAPVDQGVALPDSQTDVPADAPPADGTDGSAPGDPNSAPAADQPQ